MSFRDAPYEADRAGIYRLLIIVSTGANTIRLMRATTDRAIGPASLVEALEHAMNQTDGDLVPARPPAILVDDPEILEAIELPMRSCGVEVKLHPTLPAIGPVLEALDNKPGLFSDRSLIGTRCAERELAEAACRIAAAEPWRYFLDELPLAVKIENGPTRIVVVLGTLGHCLGIACYDDDDAYQRAIACQSSAPMAFDGWSLLFEPACAAPAARRRAIASRELPVAHALYPLYQQFRDGEQPAELSDSRTASEVVRILHAVAALVETCGEAMIDGNWEQSQHDLPGGRVDICARPDLATVGAEMLGEVEDDANPFIDSLPGEEMALPRLIPDDHIMLVTHAPAAFVAQVAPDLAHELAHDEVPCLVIRSTKKNARLAAKSLGELHGLAFGVREERGRDVELIFGLRSNGLAGIISAFGTTHDEPQLAEELASVIGADATHVTVLMVGGGTRRPPASLQLGDIVGAVRLRLVDWT